MPRAWLTPDNPAPETERCRIISVPDDLAFVGAVTGALIPLTSADNWEAQGSMTPQQAADIMSAAFELFVASDCEGEPCPAPTIPGTTHPLIRRNPSTGATEQWIDNAWVPPEGDYAVPEDIPREEETTEDRLCAGSVAAAGVLKALYVAMLDFYADEVDPYLNAAEFALQAGVLIGSSFGNISASFVALLDFAFSTFVAAMDELTVPMWSDKWHDTLICIMKDNATDTDSVITFNWSGVMADLVGLIVPIIDENILVRWQTWYIVQFLGPEALNYAATKEGYTGDCADCGNWCYTFDFTEGPQGFVTIRETSGITSPGGVWTSSGWTGTIQVNNLGARQLGCTIARQFDETTLTRIYLTYSRTNGQITQQVYANRFIINRWDDGSSVGTETTPRANLTPGSEGTDITLENTGTWTGAKSLSLALTASYRSGANPSPTGSLYLTSLTLEGEGANPFGANNCV